MQTQVRESSMEAHNAIKPKKETHYEIIKDTMRLIGKPEISRGIAYHSTLSYHEVARRLPEMEKRGDVKVTGRCAHVAHRPLLWDLIR